MGAQDEHRDGPNYDPNARSDEMPVHRVTLSPFFLSKYEMTQGQWLRSRGTNPSYYHPDNYAKSLLNPVEQVSWNACMETCGRLGLSLPSEAQWEYAARAKTSTMWSTGNDPESVLAASNLADQTARRAGTDWIEVWPESDDGYMVHASVNVFPANGFGLHNMHGNVWEWCRDGFDREFYQQGATIDPVSIPAGTIVHVFRGGSFADEALSARCSFRNRFTSESASDRVGLRPARKLER
jgi:formylglycine-generating enzyme required for sulfatase activity